MDQQLAVFIEYAFILAGVGTILAFIGAWKELHPAPPEPETDWGDWQNARYRREAILRDEMQQRIRQTRLRDQRRITSNQARIVAAVPEQIAALPLPDGD